MAEAIPSRENSIGWQRRLKAAVVTCVVCVVVVAAGQLYATLTHRPQIVYPPEALAALRENSSGTLPISKEHLDQLMKVYGLDDCTVGKKYGAVCQDGYVTFGDSADGCSGHGGVKQWIECR